MMNPLKTFAYFFPLPVLLILLIIVIALLSIVLANIFAVEWRYQPMIFLSIGLFIAGALAGWFTNSYRNKMEKETKEIITEMAPKLVSNMDVITRFNMILSNSMLKETQKELGREYREEMMRLKSYFDSHDLTFGKGIRFIVKDFMERQGI